jgi:hypothetical protein
MTHGHLKQHASIFYYGIKSCVLRVVVVLLVPENLVPGTTPVGPKQQRLDGFLDWIVLTCNTKYFGVQGFGCSIPYRK